MHRYLGDDGQLFPICLSKIAECACRQAFMANCMGGVASFKFRSIPLEWTMLSLQLVFPSRMGGEHRLTDLIPWSGPISQICIHLSLRRCWIVRHGLDKTDLLSMLETLPRHVHSPKMRH